MNKLELTREMNTVEDVLKDNGMDDNQTLLGNFEHEKKMITDFRARVLVVGAFSSGKSALLNTFMGGEKLLTENISMETAIATELFYSPEEYAVRVKLDGSEERCSIEEAKQKNPSDCLKYQFYLPNESLKNLGDIILVDMPGYGSGVKEHNKAITQYINSAAGYVYVTSADAGTFDAESQLFLDEIQNYSSSIKFVLTKCDKHTPSNTKEIASSVKNNIEYVLGKQVDLLETSSRYEDAPEKLARLFSNFDPDELMIGQLGDRCKRDMEFAKDSLITQKDALKFNSYQIDQEIAKNEERKLQLAKDMEKDKERQLDYVVNKGTQDVLNKVDSRLRGNLYELVDAAEQGDAAFNNTVSSILRPVLNESLSDVLNSSYNSTMKNIVSKFNTDNSLSGEQLVNAASGFSAGLKTLENKKSGNVAGGSYRIIASILSLATSVINPILEVLIILGPDLVNMISGLFGPSKREKLSNQIENQVIPKIVEGLRSGVADNLKKSQAEMSEKVEEDLQTKLDTINDSIKQLKQEKTDKQLNIQQKQAKLDHGIKVIEKSLKNVEAAMGE
ncbi:dynamin family protein [Limosilactobacillus sp. WILCCON 0053]|uniref:dynamin family protein n=1 Tax=Limosilactobacillus allomucosae TaxID=3142938 RepID=UPI00326548D4